MERVDHGPRLGRTRSGTRQACEVDGKVEKVAIDGGDSKLIVKWKAVLLVTVSLNTGKMSPLFAAACFLL